MDNDKYLSSGLYPIYLCLTGMEVASLWGPFDDWNHMLMARDKTILLFRNEHELVRFIKSGEQCNFSDMENYIGFQEAVRQDVWDYEEPQDFFRFDIAGKSLKTFIPSKWSAYESSMTVDCINILHDAAFTIGDMRALSFFTIKIPPEYPAETPYLRWLNDELTFYNPEKPDAKLDLPPEFNPKAAYAQFTEALGRVCIHSRMFYKEVEQSEHA